MSAAPLAARLTRACCRGGEDAEGVLRRRSSGVPRAGEAARGGGGNGEVLPDALRMLYAINSAPFFAGIIGWTCCLSCRLEWPLTDEPLCVLRNVWSTHGVWSERGLVDLLWTPLDNLHFTVLADECDWVTVTFVTTSMILSHGGHTIHRGYGVV